VDTKTITALFLLKLPQQIVGLRHWDTKEILQRHGVLYVCLILSFLN